MTMIGMQKEATRVNVFPASNSWIIQIDVGYFSEGMVSPGCVIEEPNVNISIAASTGISSHVDAITTEVLAVIWAL